MKHKMKKRFLTTLLALLLLTFLPITACANAAEPPCFVIVAEHLPDDFSLGLRLSNGDEYPPEEIWIRQKDWETYFRFQYFYSEALSPNSFRNSTLVCSTGGEIFEIPIPSEADHGYNSILKLNLTARTLTLGLSSWRTVLLAVLRVVLTLLIEGLVFFVLFRYRTRRSAVVFLLVNLATQIFLNLMICTHTGIINDAYGAYWHFLFYLCEFTIFLAESILFPAFLKEHSRRRAVLAALTANTASLALGGFLLSTLPI